MANLYPESPADAGKMQLHTTLKYRQQIVKIISCLVLFFLTYLVLFLTALSLAVSCILGGILFFYAYPSWITGITGLLLVLLGGVMLFFLIKFFFNTRQHPPLYRIQIFTKDHPRLFDFIARLAKDMHIPFPAKLFLTPDMHVTISYHASFLNLCWPARKNLEIGLGLVNSVNISEFKMLLANEFAHFSRRSMKAGSFIYLLNKQLYNFSYENENWDELKLQWSGTKGLISFFVHITAKIIEVIHYILRKFFHLINRLYLKLNWQMELYAATIAVSHSGSTAAINSLRRMEMGGYCLNYCLNKLPALGEKHLYLPNIFEAQRALIQYYAVQNYLELDAEGLPVITDQYFKTLLKSRVQMRDQWTSHATRETKEAWYRKAHIICQPLNLSTWLLFDNSENLQLHMTTMLNRFAQPVTGEAGYYTTEAFIEELSQHQRLYGYPKTFNNYYDDRPFNSIDTSFTQCLPPDEFFACNLQTLYHPDVVNRIRLFYRDRQDAETLTAIGTGQFRTRYFEFDGQKYHADKAIALAQQLADHAHKEQEWLQAHDQLVFRYHYTMAMNKSKDTAMLLTDRYDQILQLQQTGHLLNDLIIRIIYCISELYSGNSKKTTARLSIFDELSVGCQDLKTLIATTKSRIPHFFSGEMDESLEKFLLSTYIFSEDMEPFDAAITELHKGCSALMEYYNNNIILYKKAYLEFILSLATDK